MCFSMGRDGGSKKRYKYVENEYEYLILFCCFKTHK